jgi:hypothetical protein
MTYEFRYFIASGDRPVSEEAVLSGDREAVARAAGELLRMPGRQGVEVWAAGRLVYARRRGSLHD